MEPAVRLVPFTADHLEAFAPMTTDPDVLRYTRFPDPPRPDFPREWLARYSAGRATGTKEAFAIVGGDDGAETDRALDLECCNRITGGAAINVAFLSGSQKFRVAVSLALAIGAPGCRRRRSRYHQPSTMPAI